MNKKESEDMEKSLLICDNDKPNTVFDNRPFNSLDKGEGLLTVDDGKPCIWEQPLWLLFLCFGENILVLLS